MHLFGECAGVPLLLWMFLTNIPELFLACRHWLAIFIEHLLPIQLPPRDRHHASLPPALPRVVANVTAAAQHRRARAWIPHIVIEVRYPDLYHHRLPMPVRGEIAMPRPAEAAAIPGSPLLSGRHLPPVGRIERVLHRHGRTSSPSFLPLCLVGE